MHGSLDRKIGEHWSSPRTAKTLAPDRRRVGRRGRCVDPYNRRRSFCVTASRRGRGRRGS